MNNKIFCNVIQSYYSITLSDVGYASQLLYGVGRISTTSWVLHLSHLIIIALQNPESHYEMSSPGVNEAS